MRLVGAVLVLVILAYAGWYAWEVWPRPLELEPRTLAPRWSIRDGVQSVTPAYGHLVADVAAFEDELLAYLMFDFMRSASAFQGAEVLLTARETRERPVYAINLRPANDMLAFFPMLEALRAGRKVAAYEWSILAGDSLARLQQQTRVFVAAYNFPARKRLENMTRTRMMDYMRRFIEFKSRTDPRVRKGIEPVPSVLSSEEAYRMAADIITVADFFHLPLEFFLGIGAIENNYMNVRGDINNAVWKRRPEKGDIVLRRDKRGRVLVLNEASGVWQITQETLRYAHRLYRKDRQTRDYTRLPLRLRPPDELDVRNVDPEVLTTYAGLFFRYLLDRFDGDVATAVGAYNGGPGRPNARYEEWVRSAASHARKVLEHAAALNGRSVTDMQFLASPKLPAPAAR